MVHHAVCNVTCQDKSPIVLCHYVDFALTNYVPCLFIIEPEFVYSASCLVHFSHLLELVTPFFSWLTLVVTVWSMFSIQMILMCLL